MTTQLPTIMPGALPYFHRGNHIGCLIVHGFMASRGEVGWLGEYLAEQGCTVYIPRLPGHAVNPADMHRMRWQDWYGQVLDGYHILRQQCENVIVIGHSMGGLLGSLLSSAVPLDGLVIAGSPFRTPRKTMPFTRFVSSILRFTSHPTGDPLQSVIRAEQQRRGEPIIGRVNYVKWSSRAVYELHRLIQVSYDNLPNVTVPLLLVYARQDETILWGDHELVAERVNSDILELCLLDDGGHIIFQDTGRDAAFATIGQFIAYLTSYQ